MHDLGFYLEVWVYPEDLPKAAKVFHKIVDSDGKEAKARRERDFPKKEKKKKKKE